MYNQSVTDPLIGTLFAERYLINYLIARGGMGNIYQANDVKTGRIIAIKTLRLEFSDDPVLLRRFQRESDTVSNLKHPNICQIYESGRTQDGIHYFTMEYLEGQALDQVIKEQHVLPPEKAIAYMIQVAEGLSDAHDRGIVHRDLKPANIFIIHEANEIDHLKVLDFGVAKVDNDLVQVQEKLTKAGSTLGTPFYMSPEQIQGLEVDARTDIYALGVILWECVFGEPVFKGKTLIDIFRATTSQKTPKLPAHLKSSPLWQKLYDVLYKSLQKDRNKRYSSMHAFQRALEEILECTQGNYRPLKTPKSLPIWSRLISDQSEFKDSLNNLLHRISPLKLIIIGAISCICIGSIIATIVFLIPHEIVVPQEKYGTYKFFTDVPANVTMNGNVIGKTPLSIDLTTQPPFTVTIESPDFDAYPITIQESSDHITGYAVNLKPTPSQNPMIYIETVPPNAKLTLNGKQNPELSPCNINIDPDQNDLILEVSLDGYQSEILHVFSGGGDVRIRTNLFRQAK